MKMKINKIQTLYYVYSVTKYFFATWLLIPKTLVCLSTFFAPQPEKDKTPSFYLDPFYQLFEC